MNNDGMKFVRFDLYCETCKHFNKDQDQEPCNECLTHTVNYNSHRPVMWEEKK